MLPIIAASDFCINCYKADIRGINTSFNEEVSNMTNNKNSIRWSIIRTYKTYKEADEDYRKLVKAGYDLYECKYNGALDALYPIRVEFVKNW